MRSAFKLDSVLKQRLHKLSSGYITRNLITSRSETFYENKAICMILHLIVNSLIVYFRS